jgi:xanthine dehydrogenase YagS FAD-binding subunit
MITIAKQMGEALQAEGEYRAGGTDLQARRRLGLSRGAIVDIRFLKGQDEISWGAEDALSLGTLVTLHQIATDPKVRQLYPGLALSAGGLATPQIRHMATLGGALLQHTRCPYYRQPAFRCFKKGGEGCPARDGNNPNGVVFDLGPCVYPHPSTMGMALLAYDAQFVTHASGPRPVSALYGDGSDPRRDHTLQPGELLTKVLLPPPLTGEKAAYLRATSRAEAEWPTVEVLIRLQVNDNAADRVITLARVAVGSVANIPMRLPGVEEALTGQPALPEAFQIAAAQAAEGTKPLPQTGFKVELLAKTIAAALSTLEV